MAKVFSRALNKSISVNRIIGEVHGENLGPTLVFFAGVHGNEPSGVFALHQVMQDLPAQKSELKGTVIALSGNLWALSYQVRFHQTDLNRLFTRQNIEALEKGVFKPSNEDDKQLAEIFHLVHTLLEKNSGPFYFFDLHTTSSPTIPFLTVNDSLINRKFTRHYPAPQIYGLEEYLEGPLLSYLNEQGYVSFGFEGGQHDDIQSIESHEEFIYLSLAISGALPKSQIPYGTYQKKWLQTAGEKLAVYEIYQRQILNSGDTFTMKPGFKNFQLLKKGQALATLNRKTLKAQESATVFMPLYQSQGSDGFFLIRKIAPFYLWLSGLLRSSKTDSLLAWLPGINWLSPEKDTLVVDLRIAQFVAKKVFHLFGYRSKQRDEHHLYMKNREYRAKKESYKNEKWYRSKTL
jgi:succinylglutamate desuccinylase